MIKSISELIRRGISPVFDTRLKANRVEYLLARNEGVCVARGGLGPASVGAKLGESLAAAEPDRQLLSERQALLLWERTIAQSEQSDGFLDASTIARWSREAAGLAGDYRVTPRRLANEPSAETRALVNWWKTVNELQTAHGWLDPRELLSAAETSLDRGRFSVKKLAWLDRDLTHSVAQGLAKQMYRLEPKPVAMALGGSTLAAYPDPMEELRAAAAWAYDTLAEEVQGQVVVVVPGLVQRAQDVQQAFADMAPPGAPLAFLPTGSALLGYASIRAAVALVELVLGDRSFDVASTILRAPSLFKGQTLTGRGALERNLRERPDGQLWLLSAQGIGGLSSADGEGVRQFATALDRLSKARPRPGQRATPIQWADEIRRWLRLAGWYAGGPNLEQVWNDVLMRLASLGFNGEAYSRQDLLSALHREIANARVSTKMGPLEVLGRIDDVGLGCTHVWVSGLTETQYPHLPKPNPMLPLALQRQWGIPSASPQARGRRAEQALAKVRGLADEVRLSFPRSLQDAPTTPHPVLAGLAPQHFTQRQLGRTHAMMASGQAQFVGDALPKLTKRVTHGASRALAEQARCPARAFFEYRLGAKELEQPQAGVRPLDRGHWAHQVCERLFEQLPGSKQLRSSSVSAQAEIIEQLVDDVLRSALGRAHGTYRAALELEHRLLQKRMLVLLQREAQRQDFEVVEREATRQRSFGPLDVKVRIDRIDRLASGEFAVLDYKAGGTPTLNDWLEAPLRNVQLPLYVLMADLPVGAALYVQIHSTVANYQGVWPKGTFPKRPRKAAEWADLQVFWQHELERLVADFLAGSGWYGSEPDRLEDTWAPLSRIYAEVDPVESYGR